MLRVKELGFIIGLGIVGLVFVAAVIGPWLTGHDPFAQDLNARLIPPFWMEGGSSQHWFGTDQLGRDYLTRLLYGARISLFIGVLTVVTSGIIGTSLGACGSGSGWSGRIEPDAGGLDTGPVVVGPLCRCRSGHNHADPLARLCQCGVVFGLFAVPHYAP